jgi:hypothetical protein
MFLFYTNQSPEVGRVMHYAIFVLYNKGIQATHNDEGNSMYKISNANINAAKRAILVIIGSTIAAMGLQFFLLPNHLLDGGVTGISIISSYLSGLPFGLFLLLFNIPFVYLGFRKFGKEFAAYVHPRSTRVYRCSYSCCCFWRYLRRSRGGLRIKVRRHN